MQATLASFPGARGRVHLPGARGVQLGGWTSLAPGNKAKAPLQGFIQEGENFWGNGGVCGHALQMFLGKPGALKLILAAFVGSYHNTCILHHDNINSHCIPPTPPPSM